MVPVPVTADIKVGIDGAAPVGDLFLLLVFDLTGCTFPVNDPLELILDTDTTDETSCQTIPPTPVPTLPPVGMVCPFLRHFFFSVFDTARSRYQLLLCLLTGR